jgi:hypothetical protein
MKKETEKAINLFCEMFSVYIDKKMRGRISHFLRKDKDWVRLSFRENLEFLFSIYLGKEKRVILHSELLYTFPELRLELLDLFTYLGFVIEDKSK